jgi:hypothetical protein
MQPQADLDRFERELRAVAGDVGVRPFLCDGSPLSCEIFLVGINPGTDIPLWDYWSVESGCNKQGWLQAYLQKHGRWRPTRKRIELLCTALAPVRALETNVFHHRSRREADLAVEQRTTAVFDFLVKRLKPRVIFVHGRSARMHLQNLTGTLIGRGAFTAVDHQAMTFDVFAGHHLSLWSYPDVEQLGRVLQARCMSHRGHS